MNEHLNIEHCVEIVGNVCDSNVFSRNEVCVTKELAMGEKLSFPHAIPRAIRVCWS